MREERLEEKAKLRKKLKYVRIACLAGICLAAFLLLLIIIQPAQKVALSPGEEITAGSSFPIYLILLLGIMASLITSLVLYHSFKKMVRALSLSKDVLVGLEENQKSYHYENLQELANTRNILLTKIEKKPKKKPEPALTGEKTREQSTSLK